MKSSNFLVLLVIIFGAVAIIEALPDSDPIKARVNLAVYNITVLDINRQDDNVARSDMVKEVPIQVTVDTERMLAKDPEIVVVTDPQDESVEIVQTYLPFDEAYSSSNRQTDKLIKNANGGDSAAQFSLGRMYLEGNSVKKDLVIAYMWFNLARANGHVKAKEEVNQLMKQMDNRQIAEGQRLSAMWWDTYKN